MDDPKRFLKQSDFYHPDYVNTKPYSDVKKIFEKGKFLKICKTFYEKSIFEKYKILFQLQ